MTVVTVELMIGWKGFSPAIIYGECAGNLGGRQRRSTIICTMTVGAVAGVVLRIVAMSADPGLTHRVQSMRPIVWSDGHARMTHFAFGNLCHVSLLLPRIKLVVGLKRGIFGVRGTMTGRAVHATVPGTEAIKIGAGDGHVRVSRETLIGHGAPLAG